ncbi:hypothetical protein BU25DRAFT_349973 [Macroventuria anomochaeta]|uniref:Uncharacterized protein n=1 Tax=Macroventuria anomochaeta TaxID=301207 RepID=A0ACB6RRR1_9PLEO|nr:uncharacterized protein BU25DRAFT_349973 [Macroventuria anomochaeta]KAF2623604.1 hypothetical protein BU25DRAFT_349973 [Macroventuria anomochaeta]
MLKNTHLLENEIAEMDHVLYQAGLSLGLSPSFIDRLGLSHCKKDDGVPKIGDTITDEFILPTRPQTRLAVALQLDKALAAFNIMITETLSLLDEENKFSLRDDPSLHEVHKTRLLRVDLGTRVRTDPFQRWLQKYLRAF